MGYRLLAVYESHAIIERGQSIRRHPLCWIRHRNNPHLIVIPDQNLPRPELNGPPSSSDNNNALVDTSSEIYMLAAYESHNPECWNHEYLTAFACAWLTRFPSLAGVQDEINHILLMEPDWVEEMHLNHLLLLENRGSEELISSVQDGQKGKSMRLEEENELLSTTNPSRIAPRIFLLIPDAIAAIEKEIQSLLSVGRYGVPALKMVDFTLNE